MVDYHALQKKFPTKKPQKRKNAAAIKAIAREYEQKKAALGGMKAPMIKKGIVFYGVIILGLAMLGSLVLTASGKGGRAPLSKAQIQVRKSIDALAIALGRYRYHVGEYPSTEEGLNYLSSKEVRHKGWNGPYIRQVVKDPWKHDYVYIRNGEGENPTLYSKGPDGIAGTTDDILPDPKLFDEPFRDTSWTREWMPHHLRGYVLVPDQKYVAQVEAEVQEVLKQNAEAPQLKLEPITSLPRPPRPQPEHALLPHWNWEGREGEPITITCATTGDAVELYLDGAPLGRRTATQEGGFTWQVPYEAGELKAIIFREGNPIGETRVQTTGPAVAVKLTSRVESLADGEIGFVEADLVDDAGARNPIAQAKIVFSLEGPGELIPAEGDTASTFIRRTGGSGLPLKLTATAEGLRKAVLTLPRR